MQRFSRRAALLGAVAAGLAACSLKPRQPVTAPNATAAPSSPGTEPPVDDRPRWPLSGKLLKRTKDARHAAVAVKVPDNRNEHPQRGLNEADIVFVQLDGYRDDAGYSGTRLVPVFHSKMPETVTPVRSIRPVDVALLSPMNALIGNTGGAPWVMNYVTHHRKHLEGELTYQNTRGTGSYGTDPARVYTLNGQNYYDRATTCHPKVLAKQTKRFRSGPPQLYFPFASSRAEVSARQGERAKSMSIPYQGDDYFMSYRYDKKSRRYLRSMPWGPHVLADGTRVATDNVLVIKAAQSYGKIFRGRGDDEPLHGIIDAAGEFSYFNRGRYVSGTWRKGGVAEPFTFELDDGSPFRMAPGRTFVELPDTGAELRIDS